MITATQIDVLRIVKRGINWAHPRLNSGRLGPAFRCLAKQGLVVRGAPRRSSTVGGERAVLTPDGLAAFTEATR